MELKHKIIAFFVASNVFFATGFSSFCIRADSLGANAVPSAGIFNFILDTAAPINAINALVKKIVLNDEIKNASGAKEQRQESEPQKSASAVSVFSSSGQAQLAKKNKDGSQFQMSGAVFLRNCYIPDKLLTYSVSQHMRPPPVLLLFMLIYLAIIFRDEWINQIHSRITELRLHFNTAVVFYFGERL